MKHAYLLRLIVLFLSVFLLGACAAEPKEPLVTGGGKTTQTTDPDPEPDPVPVPHPKPAPSEGTPLRAFCNDPELDAWFESIDENPPVKLEYWIYGEAPYSLEFTDPELILSTVDALQTVKIGGASDENPDNWLDAGGQGYYFTMEDDSHKFFSFTMGYFEWNDSGWHDVADFGDLTRVSNLLHETGYHEYTYIYADDDGFYTEYYDLYETGWEDEDNLFGGIRIYLAEEGVPPFVSVRRILGEKGDPKACLENTLISDITRMLEEGGGSMDSASQVQDVTIGKQTLPGATLHVTDIDGAKYRVDVLVDEYEDNLLTDESVLVQFSAVYDDSDSAQEDAAAEALLAAVRNFYLHSYKRYEEASVQPGKLLFDFMNDARMNEWLEQALQNPPYFLNVRLPEGDVMVEDDPETVRTVLYALASVRIGDEAKEIVGASDPRYYMFIDLETGEGPEIMFHKNTLHMGMISYEVLDWGDLEKVNRMLLDR